MFWLIILTAIIVFAYWKLIKQNEQWKIAGVKYVPLFDWPKFCLFNPMFHCEKLMYLYEKYPTQRYTGVYQVFKPILMIKDLNLLRNVMVKDFEHFTDHVPIISEAEYDPLWSRNLLSLEGEKWKNMRSTLSPAFTSSKMKAMFQLMTECSQQFTGHFEKENSDIINVDLKDIFTRYSTDIIGTCAFGIETNSMKDRENDFYMMGQEFSKLLGFKTLLKFAIMLAIPKITKIVKISIFGDKFYNFFSKLVYETITTREAKKIYRPDMIHLLMEAQKGKLKYEEDSSSHVGFAAVTESNVGMLKEKQITLTDMTSQAFLFFLAGFDSISTMVSFMAYELALATDVQEKLHTEIVETIAEHGENVGYEALNGMKYLDMVISETLRKYPMATVTDRICTKDYTISAESDREMDVTVKAGNVLMIPIWAIHHDARYYENPFRFDPERFNDGNKVGIKPFMYMPFGAGPRNCIGSRFALLETKALFFNLLRKFEIAPNKHTPIPIHFRTDTFPLTTKDKLLVDLKRRIN